MWPVCGFTISAVGWGARGGAAVRSTSIAVGVGSEPTSGVQAPASAAAAAIAARTEGPSRGRLIAAPALQRNSNDIPVSTCGAALLQRDGVRPHNVRIATSAGGPNQVRADCANSGVAAAGGGQGGPDCRRRRG